MSRHSKNTAASAVFSVAERRRLKYGTQSTRVGGESQKVFDACEICLHTAEQPLICAQGHVFCKGCIYECISSQKDQQKLQQVQFEATLQLEAREKERAAEQEKQKVVLNFEKLDAAVVKGIERAKAISTDSASSSSRGAALTTVAPAGYIKVQTNSTRGEGFIVDHELVSKLAESTASSSSNSSSSAPAASSSSSSSTSSSTNNSQSISKAIMPAFWLPSMTPASLNTEKVHAPPSKQCMCPGSNHPIKLKQLKPIKWCLDRTGAAAASDSSSSSSGGPRPMCFSCKKLLKNETPMVAITKCSHVLCKVCVDTVMIGKKVREFKAATSNPDNNNSGIHPTASFFCLECDTPCRADDLVPVVAATSYAATGNKIVSAKLTPAFQC